MGPAEPGDRHGERRPGDYRAQGVGKNRGPHDWRPADERSSRGRAANGQCDTSWRAAGAPAGCYWSRAARYATTTTDRGGIVTGHVCRVSRTRGESCGERADSVAVFVEGCVAFGRCAGGGGVPEGD